MSLFHPLVIKRALASLYENKVEEAWKKFTAHFHNLEVQENIRRSKEEQYQEGFLTDLFVNVFGYTKNPNPKFNLTTELKNVRNAKKTDGAILRRDKVLAVIELKGMDTTDLSKVEQQAFNYKNNQSECVYVITSNFEKLRFYIHDAVEFEEFNLFTITRERFKLLYFCLAEEKLRFNAPESAKSQSISDEEVITKNLYKDYAEFRSDVFKSIQQLNPNHEKLLLFKKTQKLLDRFLFIFFAEDKSLIPPKSVERIINDWRELERKHSIKIPLYDKYKTYFGYLNTGKKDEYDDIFPYNGGLFAPDELLESLKIDDRLLARHTAKISGYDFDSEVSVNILGHIFEHSMNEFEEIQAEIEEREFEKTTTRRKKDGVFYTPKYITKYIVDNTIGSICIEKKQELGIIEENYVTEDGKPIKDKKIITKLQNTLQSYRTWLLQITICDPACGSGAFLNEALEFLISEHRYLNELEKKWLGKTANDSNLENEILKNNIFGVDINEESVEIAKLSLWIRTAQKGRKLTTLNDNLKVGNSLIKNVGIAGNKAFNWQKEFPQVFEKGGFDVIIGNPPYVLCQPSNTSEKTLEYYKRYKVASYKIDLFHLFFEKSINLLINKGKLGFITPNTYLTNKYIKPLRVYILDHSSINKLITYENTVFVDAGVDVSTLILTKEQRENNKIEIILANDKKWNLVTEIPQNNWKNNNECIFNSKLEFKINLEKCISLSQICDSYFGIQAYDRKTAISEIKINKEYKPIIDGGDVFPYQYSLPTKFFNFSDYNIKSGGNYDVYSEERIVVRQIGKTPIVGLCKKDILASNTLYNLNLKNKSFNIKYILAILNSNTIKCYWLSKYSDGKQLFPKIKGYQLKELPIPKISEEAQKPFIDLVNNILSLNDDFLDKKNRFLRRVQDNFKLKSFPKKLEKFYDLRFAEFLKEISKKQEKSKSIISPYVQDEWEKYFTGYKKDLLVLHKEIQSIDDQIDSLVFELYGLTEEEIAIVKGLD